MNKKRSWFVCGALLLTATSAPQCVAAQEVDAPLTKNTERADVGMAFDWGLGDPQNAISDFKNIFKIINKYRERHEGKLPDDEQAIHQDIAFNLVDYGFKSYVEARKSFTNPDYALTDPKLSKEQVEKTWVYNIILKRQGGAPVQQGAQFAGTKDILAWTDLYFRRNISYSPDGTSKINPIGFYIVLWDDGTIDEIPFDLVYFCPKGENAFSESFPGQVNREFNCVSYEEFFGLSAYAGKPNSLLSKEVVLDNGGPESLVQLSRWQNVPNHYGISRQDIWKQLKFEQAEFSLAEIQAAAANLGMNTQVQKLPLEQVLQHGSAALLFLKDDGRVVTLTALDDDRAVIVDRGQTNIVERSILQQRYSGESLTPKTPEDKPAISSENPVREIRLTSRDEENSQTLTLHNTGDKPITLRLEYPLLGVTESNLSKNTLAPGDTATLDVKVKWRPNVSSPTQNVLVNLRTSDPSTPRLQFAMLLIPPAVRR